jgi:CHASE1-domain containing sensor protein/anti-sigma regulatory factor (Ser/Thr protein kinase)/GAF domain-containing protein
MAGETSAGASPRSWLAKRWPSAVLVGSLMVLALVSAVSTANFQRQRSEASKAETATTASATLRSTMQQTLSALGGSGAVVGRRDELDLAAFSSFGRGLVIEPGVSTLALAQIVLPAERAAFERRTGFPIVDLGAGGDFVTSPDRDVYYPVVAVSPNPSGMRSILGFDIGNDAVRGPVALAALESGVPQLSPPLQLSTSGEPGFNVVVPVFRRRQPIETIEHRRAAAVGFVSGLYSSDELIALVEQQLPSGTRLAIFDGDQVVRGDRSSEQEGITRQLTIGGRAWTLSVVVPGGPGIWGPFALFIAGVLLAGFVQAAISLARRREEILEVSGRRLQAEAKRSDAIRELSGALLDAEDEPAVIAAIVRCAGAPFGATEVELGVISDDGRTIEVFRQIEGDPAESNRGTIPIEGDDIVARVARARAPVFEERTDTPSRSAAALSVDGKTLGAIVLGFDDGRRLDRDDRALVMDLAAAGARALEQARLHAAVEQAWAQAERDRALVESQRQLSLQLSRAATAETAADIVLRRAISVTHSLAGGVALAHEDGYLEFVAVRGIAGDDAGRMPQLALDDRTASSQTFRTGKESMAATAEEFRSRFPDGYAIAGAEGRGVWALPLVAKGEPIGAVVLIVDGQHLPSDDDRSAVRALAAQVAPALGRARTSDRTREAAEELQRAMLPAALPRVPGAAVTGLYRSATQILEVGGDWYDAVETGEDTLMVAVGDVVGRGVAAAATMGQLRVAWRALSQRSEGPGALLSALDRFARDLPGAEVTTVACAELEVGTGRLRYACAGHLPPLVVDRSGNARFLEDGRSVPLAIADVRARDEAQVTIQIGDTLVLYTDGLVERRDETLDEGLERLRAEAERLSGSGDDLAGELAASLVDEGRSVDDVAILTLTLLPSFRRVMDRDALELAPTRAAVRAWMQEQGAGGEMVEEMVLASGEALANAIEHAVTPDPIEVRGWSDHERITLRVTDRGAWANGEPMNDRGFGLAIMRELMDDVHVETDERGTRVELRRAIRPGC